MSITEIIKYGVCCDDCGIKKEVEVEKNTYHYCMPILLGWVRKRWKVKTSKYIGIIYESADLCPTCVENNTFCFPDGAMDVVDIKNRI